MKTIALTEDQRADYDELGYIILPGVFDSSEIKEMADEADRLLEFIINSSLALGKRNPRLDLQQRDGISIVRKIQPINDASEVLERYCNDERLVGPMREILGCEPIIMEEKLNYKQPLGEALDIVSGTHGEKFEYHLDWAYYRLQGYPRETLSSAISIDETTPQNGPIRILPGSHKKDWPMRGEDTGDQILPEGVEIPEDEVIDVLAPAGSVMVFHSCLVHSSKENITDEPRRLMIYSHYPSTHQAEPDSRNRGLREMAQKHEHEYRAKLAEGFQPTFNVG